MANVDREMAALGEERAEKSKRLNLKRMQHVSTLQQLSKFFLWKWSTTHSVWKFINGLIRISREIVTFVVILLRNPINFTRKISIFQNLEFVWEIATLLRFLTSMRLKSYF